MKIFDKVIYISMTTSNNIYWPYHRFVSKTDTVRLTMADAEQSSYLFSILT